jgi:DNA-binding response OmpR family regulator
MINQYLSINAFGEGRCMYTLILADPDLLFRRQVCSVFPGIPIRECSLGSDVLLLASLAKDPTVILMDLALPDYHGLDLLSQLRRNYPNLILIAFSHTQITYSRAAVLQAGANDYLVSPISLPLLPVRLKLWLHLHESEMLPLRQTEVLPPQAEKILTQASVIPPIDMQKTMPCDTDVLDKCRDLMTRLKF